MKRLEQKPLPLPQFDYGLALRNAVSWLGDRYLLAVPATRRPEEPRPFFVEPRRWHDSARAAGPKSRKA
jgi:hypothetical protein